MISSRLNSIENKKFHKFYVLALAGAWLKRGKYKNQSPSLPNAINVQLETALPM